MRGKLRFAVGFAAGYVLGAKAGRERYEQIMRQVKDLLERPEVQDIAAKGRETIGQGAQRGAGVATDQMERVRAAMSSSHEGSAGPEPARGADATAKASGKDEPQRQPSSATPRPEQPPSPPA